MMAMAARTQPMMIPMVAQLLPPSAPQVSKPSSSSALLSSYDNNYHTALLTIVSLHHSTPMRPRHTSGCRHDCDISLRRPCPHWSTPERGSQCRGGQRPWGCSAPGWSSRCPRSTCSEPGHPGGPRDTSRDTFAPLRSFRCWGCTGHTRTSSWKRERIMKMKI